MPLKATRFVAMPGHETAVSDPQLGWRNRGGAIPPFIAMLTKNLISCRLGNR